jgi:hypothetical protein
MTCVLLACQKMVMLCSHALISSRMKLTGRSCCLDTRTGSLHPRSFPRSLLQPQTVHSHGQVCLAVASASLSRGSGCSLAALPQGYFTSAQPSHRPLVAAAAVFKGERRQRGRGGE